MKKILTYIVAVLVIGVAVYFVLKGNSSNPEPTQSQTSFDARNSTFKVENMPVTLVNGVAEAKPASVPGAKITTRYFGNEVRHDLNNDGREDSVFLVTQDGGGSGTFFYVVAVLNTAQGYVGSNSYPLGDRIAPQSMYIDEGTTTRGTMRDNVIVVNYAVRKVNEPMTTPPSVGKSAWIKLDPATMEFGVLPSDGEFNGETTE